MLKLIRLLPLALAYDACDGQRGRRVLSALAYACDGQRDVCVDHNGLRGRRVLSASLALASQLALYVVCR